MAYIFIPITDTILHNNLILYLKSKEDILKAIDKYFKIEVRQNACE